MVTLKSFSSPTRLLDRKITTGFLSNRLQHASSLKRPFRRPKPVLAAYNPSPVSLESILASSPPPANLPHVFAAFPYALPSFSIQTPSFFSVLTFLLSHPFVTLSLAIFLYVTIPRLWRAFIKYIVVPTAVLGAGFVVVRNPDSFRSAGTFVAHFTSDHPYVTSGAILVALTLVLSPYVLTALLALFIATGVPRLPAPVRNFLPAPFLEVEQSIASFDSVVRGPINAAKEKATIFGSDVTARGSSLLSSTQSKFLQSQQAEKAPALTDRRE